MWPFSKKKSSAPQPPKPNQSSPAVPNLVIERLPSEMNANSYWVEVGDNVGGAKYIRTFYVEWKGRTTWLGMLDPLVLPEGDGEVDFTISFEPTDESIQIQRMSARIAVLRNDAAREKNASKKMKLHSEISDLETQIARLNQSAEKLFKVSTMVNVGAKSPEQLRRVSRTLQKRLSSRANFYAFDTKQLDAWLHALGIGERRDFDHTYQDMETSNIADLFPLAYGGISHRKGALLGLDQYHRPVFYDGWDRRLQNPHMVILGESGSGKSKTLKTLIRRSKSQGIRTGIIDHDREYKNLITSMGGAYVELSASSTEGHRINIYDVEEEENEYGQVVTTLKDTVDTVKAVLFKMIRLVEPTALTGAVKVAILQSIHDLYKKWEINSDPNSLYVQTPTGNVKKSPPTLSDHYKWMERYEDLQEVRKYIRSFTKEGDDPTKAIFDGYSTFSLGNIEVFSICLANLEKEWMRPLGSLVATMWSTVNFVLKNRRQKKRLIVDEAQVMMEDDEGAKWLEDCFRRFRKLNTSIVAATQGFEVFMRSQYGLGILKNAATKLLLRQSSHDIDSVRGKFNLSEGEAQFLLTTPDLVGILKVDKESTVLQMVLTPNEDWLYSTNPNDMPLPGHVGGGM